jgi:hypothetical protein
LKLSPLFDLEGVGAAAGWVRNNLRFLAAERWIHEKTITGQLHYAMLLGKRWHSSLELYNCVMAQFELRAAEYGRMTERMSSGLTRQQVTAKVPSGRQ